MIRTRWLLLLGLTVFGCAEPLPSRIVPPNPLVIDNVTVSQGTGDFGIQVVVSVGVRNNFEETFDGQVSINGELHIWWKNRPDVEVHLPIQIVDQIRLVPGASYQIRELWFLQTDDGQSVLDLLIYPGDVRFGISYARPETFVAEMRMTVFDATGLLSTGPQEFTLQGWRLDQTVDE